MMDEEHSSGSSSGCRGPQEHPDAEVTACRLEGTCSPGTWTGRSLFYRYYHAAEDRQAQQAIGVPLTACVIKVP